MNKPEEPPLGLIPMNSLFSPVKKFHIQLVQREKVKL